MSGRRAKEICNYSWNSPGTAYHFKFISANHLNLESGTKNIFKCYGSCGLKQKSLITVDDRAAPPISNLRGIRTFPDWKTKNVKKKYSSPNLSQSNYSCPLAERTSGKISNSVLGGFQPSFKQT